MVFGGFGKMFNDDNKYSCAINRHGSKMWLRIYPNDPLQILSNTLTPLIVLAITDIGVKSNNEELTNVDSTDGLSHLWGNVEECRIRGQDVMCISKEVGLYYYFKNEKCPHKNLPEKTLFLTQLTFMEDLSKMVTVDIAIRPSTPEEAKQESGLNIDDSIPYFMKTTAHVNMP